MHNHVTIFYEKSKKFAPYYTHGNAETINIAGI